MSDSVADGGKASRWNISQGNVVAILALLLGAVVQFSGLVWMMSSLSTRVEVAERAQAQDRKRIEEQVVATTQIGMQLGRIDERLAALMRASEAQNRRIP